MSIRKAVYRYEVETARYLAAIATAGGTISTASGIAVNEFVKSCKGYAPGGTSLWSKLTEVAPFAGNQLTAALVRLKDAFGVPTSFTNHGFLNGNYSEAGGLVGAGSQYLDSSIAVSGLASGGIVVYTQTALSTAGVCTIAGMGDTRLHVDGDTNVMMQFSGEEVPFSSGGAGYFSGQVGAVIKAYRNNGIGAGSIGPGGTATGNLFVFANNVDDAAEEHFESDLGFFAFTQALSASESNELYQAVQVLQAALGRDV